MICVKCRQDVPDGPFCCLCGASQQPKRQPRHRGNGMGTVVKRGKTWTAVATIGGYADEEGKWHQLRRTKGGFKTKTEALSYIPKLLDQPDTSSQLATLVAAYKAGAYRKLSDSKQTSYKIALDRWKPLYHKRIQDLTLDKLQAVLDGAVSTYYPAHDMQNVLSKVYQIAMAQRQVPVNLARMLALPPLEEQEPIPFSEIEIHKIWQAYADGRSFMAYLLAMIYSGMMPGELLDLKADAIDFDHREIRGIGLKTDCRKQAAIVFPPLLIPVLEDLVEHQGRTGRLVPMNKWTWYKRYHEEVVAIGVRDLPPYSCRHTTATALALDNIAPSAIQKVMRHAKLATTQHYIHMTDNEAHEAVDSMTKGKEA